ncbi:hypothetical protein TIFTF001_031783 [Ficus carica]|uniref:Uncharacterized protein n=1 Tax=Ficus carica TaxID=3494 RepID=A0AA88DY56_FICCA|nr:hypothetical protein TIFTF001_031783 [Ficus carica]
MMGWGPARPGVGGWGCGHRRWGVAGDGAQVAGDGGKVIDDGEDWGGKG